MTYATKQITATEGIIPYRNGSAQTHIRFKGDWRTFCGKDCEHWVPTEMPDLDSSYTCKRCVKTYWE